MVCIWTAASATASVRTKSGVSGVFFETVPLRERERDCRWRFIYMAKRIVGYVYRCVDTNQKVLTLRHRLLGNRRSPACDTSFFDLNFLQLELEDKKTQTETIM
ncbi:hypothetical protein QE152_g27114 [Popillia japonica]|uniref:Secreted protein n=1 Tax=Popillia japonica TaxID=7064 RepID=A0AAW1JW02_POPJA